MCCVLSVCGMALDFIQRIVTCILGVLISCLVCVGLVVAIAAGIAYGYNYSLSEFLTFTRQDVSVYMRRGQFYDKPDLDLDRETLSRRQMIGSRRSGEYKDSAGRRHKGLPKFWGLDQDARQYAEGLAKFTKEQTKEIPDVDFLEDFLFTAENIDATRTTPNVNTTGALVETGTTTVHPARTPSGDGKNNSTDDTYLDVLQRKTLPSSSPHFTKLFNTSFLFFRPLPSRTKPTATGSTATPEIRPTVTESDIETTSYHMRYWGPHPEKPQPRAIEEYEEDYNIKPM